MLRVLDAFSNVVPNDHDEDQAKESQNYPANEERKFIHDRSNDLWNHQFVSNKLISSMGGSK